MRRLVRVGLTVAGVLVASQATAQDPMVQARVHLTDTPNQGVKALVRLRANVVGMDRAVGTMTLARATDSALTVHGGPVAEAIGAVQVGDTVVVHYVRPLALHIRPARDSAIPGQAFPEPTVAAAGRSPRTVVAGVSHVVAFLRTVDLQARIAVLEIDAGGTIDVGLPIEVDGLDRVRFGERVAISLTEPVVVELESHEPASTLRDAVEGEQTGGSGPVWGYSGANGPEHWGELGPEYAVCGTGRQQSPIDLNSREPRWPSPKLSFGYFPVALRLVNDGHTVVFKAADGGGFSVGRTTYALSEMHIHSPSEHTIDGQPFELEFQLVHHDDEGRVAVIAILVERGRTNALLAPVWPRLPQAVGAAVEDPDVQLNFEGLLPRDRSHYSYQGSLSMPPCNEGVEWLVMRKPIECSRAQIAAFRTLYRDNARPVQRRNGRKVGLRWAR